MNDKIQREWFDLFHACPLSKMERWKIEEEISDILGYKMKDSLPYRFSAYALSLQGDYDNVNTLKTLCREAGVRFSEKDMEILLEFLNEEAEQEEIKL